MTPLMTTHKQQAEYLRALATAVETGELKVEQFSIVTENLPGQYAHDTALQVSFRATRAV